MIRQSSHLLVAFVCYTVIVGCREQNRTQIVPAPTATVVVVQPDQQERKPNLTLTPRAVVAVKKFVQA